ncbi:MAG: hypothetical protein AB4080_26270 [Trichodesmium sp.]
MGEGTSHFSYQLASYGRNCVNSYQLSVPTAGKRSMTNGNQEA